jgi:D-alanine-D-alanine ligase-like ATP-grasp enzyme
MTTRVLHLAGSAESDFFGDLSRLYTRDCLDAVADPGRYDVHIAYVTPDRRWRFASDLSVAAIRAAEPMALPAAVARLAELEVDVAVPQRFCRPGMTSYRALLDTIGIPYVGNTPEAVRSYADKIRRTGAGELELVAKDTTRAWTVDPADPVTQRVWEAAKLCHTALGCRHYSLFDFRIDPAGEPWFLEAGLHCSFARTSVISTMAEAAGIPLAELFRSAVGEALGK